MRGGLGGGANSYTLSSKKRWRWLIIAVIGLVFLSMLVPLIFLLGLHNGFHSPGLELEEHIADSGDRSRKVDELIKKLRPTLSKDGIISLVNESGKSAIQVTRYTGFPLPPSVVRKSSSTTNSTGAVHAPKVVQYRKFIDDERIKSCESKYGSYCLWRQEHKEEMNDSMVKKLKDQLFVARAYYPSIAKLPSQDKLSHEMKQNIQELERVLSDSTTDSDLPPELKKKSSKMEGVIARAKSFPVDCNNVDKKLRQIVDMTEDEANFHMRQSAFLFQLSVHTMPKSLHCLSMRLTQAFFESPSVHDKPQQISLVKKDMNPEQHYVIFSTNELASSVVINSTVIHSKDSRNQVFYILTDAQNFYAMKLWYSRNSYKEAAVRVVNIEELNLKFYENSALSLANEFRISFHESPESGMRTEYLSLFSHSHYLLPEIFMDLKKIVVLGDDIVVQQDLSSLWEVNMGGKVNGAVPFCRIRVDQLKSILDGNDFDGKACVWMSGLNVIDLARWREQKLTDTYWRLVREAKASADERLLRANLITFEDQIFALESKRVLSGLGHDYGIDVRSIKEAGILHYNGNMKPWLELGIPKYRAYWNRFLNPDNPFLSQCNINS